MGSFLIVRTDSGGKIQISTFVILCPHGRQCLEIRRILGIEEFEGFRVVIGMDGADGDIKEVMPHIGSKNGVGMLQFFLPVAEISEKGKLT